MNIVFGILAFLLVPGHVILAGRTIRLLDETFEGRPTKISEETEGIAFGAIILCVTGLVHGVSGYMLIAYGDNVTMNFVLTAGGIVTCIVYVAGSVRGLTSSVWPVALASSAVYIKFFEQAAPGEQSAAHLFSIVLASLAIAVLLVHIVRWQRSRRKFALNYELERYTKKTQSS